MSKEINEFKNSLLLPRLLARIKIANYIKTKNEQILMKVIKDTQINYPALLEAKCIFRVE